MEKTAWNSLHPVQQAILLAMARYECENQIQRHKYKVIRVFDYSKALFRMSEAEFCKTLYSIARDGVLIDSAGNIYEHSNGGYTMPEIVEVALSDLAKEIIPK